MDAKEIYRIVSFRWFVLIGACVLGLAEGVETSENKSAVEKAQEVIEGMSQ